MARRAQLLLWIVFVLALGATPAGAAVGDPDPAFGTGGVALVPGTNRLSGQDAPLVQADGRIVATSLVPGDVLFLSRFTAAGQPDPTFGTGAGTPITKGTTTGIKAPLKRAATALAPGDAIVVAGGSTKGGTITVGRFTKDGAVDKTFNRTGKLVVSLKGRKAMLPTSMAVLGDGSVLVTVLGDAGGTWGFTVVRITPAGRLDTTWGAGKGWVQVPIGSRPSGAFDLAVLSSGGLVLVGGVLDAAHANPTDTAIVKLDPAGRPDPAFGAGDGVVTEDLSAAGAADGAFGVAPLATGGFFVTGPSGSQGMVARFTSTGALDAAFGTAGAVYGGLAPAGSRFVPADVTLDDGGDVVVAGTILNFGGVSTGTRWGVTRLAAAGTSIGFTSAPQACSNRTAKGPSGVAVSGARILVAGSCTDKGTSAVMALVDQAFEPELTATLEAAQQEAGYERVALGALDPTAVLRAAETLQSAPFRASPFRASPFRASPFRASPFRASPFRASPFRASPFRASGVLESILLSDIPLKDTVDGLPRSWAELLRGTAFAQVPLQTVTLGQVIDLPPVLELTLDDFDLTRTPFADLSLAALLLYPIPLTEFPTPDGGWGTGVDPARTTFLDLERGGRDLTGYYRTNLGLRGVDFDASTDPGGARSILAQVPLTGIDLGRTPFANVDPGTATTLGQLLARLPIADGPQDVTLGQLLLAFVDEDSVPFERTALPQLLAAAELRQDRLLSYRVEFEVDCPSGAHLLDVTVPGDARYVPGSSSLGAPVAGDRTLTFDLCSGAPAGRRAGTLAFRLEPGSELGPRTAAFALRGTDVADTVPVVVTDDDEDRAELQEGVLRTGHLSDAGDVDTFTIPAPPVGAQLTVTLSHLPADYDLELTGPSIDDAAEATPFRASPFRASPFRASPVGDPTGDAADPALVSPNATQDAPFRASEDRRAVSVKRGTADESVTLVSRASDQGGPGFTVHVAGFDGANAPEPYVLRTTVSEAPAPPACRTRGSLSDGPAGTLPDQLPEDTQTLVLVADRRMRALHPTGVDDMLDTIRREYLGRDEVRGELVHVEDDPDVRAAYGHWDAEPCSVRRADDVVAAINRLVDRYRAAGLPELRNVVLVGPDIAIPQKRVADESRLANERTFAEDMEFGGTDDAVSRALREGHLLTDDAYGDFDPQSLGTRQLYIPDVAVGRLLETPAQIQEIVAAYVRNDGRVPATSGYVAGYDFLSDAAHSIFTGLEPLFGDRVVNDATTWDAAAGRAGLSLDGGISSVNAHFDTYRALPARGFAGNVAEDLMQATDPGVQPSPRTLLFTIGCHSGLNVAAAGLAGVPDTDPRLQDWTGVMAGSGATWVGQTGYGLGDSETIAYSERLMSAYARLIGEQRSSLGQALMYAKQDYAATSVGLLDDYDLKAVQEATYYGLPTYVTGTAQAARAAAPAMGSRTARRAAAAAADEQPRSSRVTYDFGDGRTPPYVVHDDTDDDGSGPDTDRGTYWTVGEHEPLVISRRPIQPRWTVDVTADDDLPAHGALVDDLAMREVPGVDPVIARPIVDDADREPEPGVLEAPFPATLAAVSPLLTPDGPQDRLTLFTGQFRPDGTTGTGTQRLFTRMGVRVLRSASPDYDPPRIQQTDGAVTDSGTVAFGVQLPPGEGAIGGIVLYRTGTEAGSSATWQSAELTPVGPDRLGAAAGLPAGADRVVEWTAQVHDAAGNVGTSTNKVLGYAAIRSEAPAGDPEVEFSGATLGTSGAYGAPPSVTVDSNGSDATYERSVDGGPWVPYTGAFTPSGLTDGAHTVRVRGSDGRTGAGAFTLDTEAPAITAAPSPAANGEGWHDTAVDVEFLCSDAGTGVQTCPATRQLTADGVHTFEVTATDRAGRARTIEVGPYRIDRTAPPPPAVENDDPVELVEEDPLSGTATDTGSGPLDVVVTYTEQQGDPGRPDPGKDRQVVERRSCEPGPSCEWAVPRPPDGYWSASVVTIDRAGNTSPAEVVDVVSRASCFDCDGGGTFSHEGFESTDELRLNGVAATAPGGVGAPPVIRLTEDVGSRSGSVFRRQPIDTRNSFSVEARFEMSSDAFNIGDGMALVLHRDPEAATALGVGGGGIGYHGLRPSLEVEYDTFGNYEFEPEQQHVAVQRDGDHEDEQELALMPVGDGETSFDLVWPAGDRWTWIDYDAQAGVLDVYLSDHDARPELPLLSYEVDLQEAVGDVAFIGWTAGTGLFSARHDLKAFDYESFGPEGPPNLVVNGSFERPDIPTGTIANLGEGVRGWTKVGGPGSGIELQDRFNGALPDADRGGHQWVELDSDGNTRMEQVIPTDPGVQYDISWRFSPRPGSAAADGDYWVQVTPADGRVPPSWSTVHEIPTTGGGVQTDWQRRGFRFTADTPDTTIAFESFGPSNGIGALIDDVRVVPVDPPCGDCAP